MDAERRIVDNLGRSETWFVQTFAHLKKVCGASLHQIDFKDYQQLHSVIKTQTDCDALLKHNIYNVKSLDHLVGAARNLFTSLQGAKWLFDVKNLMNKQTGVKDLSELLKLYIQARDLDIDFAKQQEQEEEYILMDDDTDALANKEVLLIREFAKLGSVSFEFDRLFGTHQKVISTLEKYEEQNKMEDLMQITDRLHRELTRDKGDGSNVAHFPQSLIKTENEFGQGYAISTAVELEILVKVRTYINLNKDYHCYMKTEDVHEAESPVRDPQTNEREA